MRVLSDDLAFECCRDSESMRSLLSLPTLFSSPSLAQLASFLSSSAAAETLVTDSDVRECTAFLRAPFCRLLRFDVAGVTCQAAGSQHQEQHAGC